MLKYHPTFFTRFTKVGKNQRETFANLARKNREKYVDNINNYNVINILCRNKIFALNQRENFPPKWEITGKSVGKYHLKY